MYLKHCEVESRVEFFKCDIQETIKSHSTIKKWAYILHDKDDTAPHYHIYLNFGKSGVDSAQVASWFGLQESQVNRIKGTKTDILVYLIHGKEDQRHKYQYPAREVVANFDFTNEIAIVKVLGHFERYSYAQQLDFINKLPVSEKAAAHAKLMKLWKLECQVLTLNSERKIDVIFITGKGGTGKTFYAKKLLRQMGYDFCVSSGTNDSWQDYMGQNAIILDDVRDSSFRFENLLKMLDNDTRSSVVSRFQNKIFNGKVIVITSSVPIKYWYRGVQWSYGEQSVENEDLVQLYRRIGCYVSVTRDEVTVYDDGLDSNGNPVGLGQIFKNEIPELQKAQKPKTKFSSVFALFSQPGEMPVAAESVQQALSGFAAK